MKREYFLDWLKVALTILVVVHHTAIGYGASGGWCYITPEVITGWPQIALSAFLSVNQAYFMSLFFFISAYLMPDSYERKGFERFLKNRFVRLGIPLLVYCIIIHPTLLYYIQVHNGNTTGSLLAFITDSNLNNPNTAHLWFVLSLLIFETIYAVLRRFARKETQPEIPDRTPGHFQFMVLIFVTGIVAFLLRTVYPIGGKNFIGLQIGYFTLYTAFYWLGIEARRKNWLEKLALKTATPWFIAAVVTIPAIIPAWLSIIKEPALMTEYIGGFHLRSLFLSFWEAIVCTGLCMFFVLAAKKFLNRENTLITSLSLNSYTAYIIHPILVVVITILLEPVKLAPFAKFMAVCLLAPAFCFITANLIRTIPGIKKIL